MNKDCKIKVKRGTRNTVGSANKLLIVLFAGFISVFFLLIMFLPKHEGELSPNERRVLASAPNTSLGNILSGKFSGEVDTWMEDHFPARNAFVSIYSHMNLYSGRSIVEKVTLGKNNRLFSAPVQRDDETMKTNAEKISGFITENDLNAFTFIIPSAGYMLPEELPAVHREYADGQIIDALNSVYGLRNCAKSIFADNVFNNAGNVSELYYRTDHHLTMKGSYITYCAIAKNLGFEPLAESEFEKRSYSFYGTAYGQSGLWEIPADDLQTWIGSYDSDLSVTVIDGTVETEHRGSLDTDKLSDDVVDKYAAYLYSNHGITKIVNPNVESGTLFVLKDSYGNAIVPFLAAHYNTIIMLDTRTMYYSPTMPAPSELAKEYNAKDFVVIYGVDTVAAGNIDWLR